MSLKPADIDKIIQLLTQITEALSKTDFLTPEEQTQLNKYNQYERNYNSYELWRKIELQYSRLGVRSFDEKEDEQRRKKVSYDKDVLAALENKLWKAKQEYIESTIKPLQKELKLYLVPRWDDIWPYTTQAQRNHYQRGHRAYGNVEYDLQRDIEQSFLKEPLDFCVIIQNSQKIIDEMKCIRAIFDYNQRQVPTETGQDKASSTTQKPPKMFGDTITTPMVGLQINWRVCWDKLKNLPKAIRKFLSGRN
jgi:hypothetical protein